MENTQKNKQKIIKNNKNIVKYNNKEHVNKQQLKEKKKRKKITYGTRREKT